MAGDTGSGRGTGACPLGCVAAAAAITACAACAFWTAKAAWIAPFCARIDRSSRRSASAWAALWAAATGMPGRSWQEPHAWRTPIKADCSRGAGREE